MTIKAKGTTFSGVRLNQMMAMLISTINAGIDATTPATIIIGGERHTRTGEGCDALFVRITGSELMPIIIR